jgi:excisionase family DNA binding protein
MASKIVLRQSPSIETGHPAVKQQASLRLLSIHDAAQYSGVSRTTVRRWIKAGELKIYRAGRQIRINEQDLVEFLSGETLKWL